MAKTTTLTLLLILNGLQREQTSANSAVVRIAIKTNRTVEAMKTAVAIATSAKYKSDVFDRHAISE